MKFLFAVVVQPMSSSAQIGRISLIGVEPSTEGREKLYSDRKALVGSRDAARRAGMKHASSAITRKSTRIAAYVSGSVGFTPTSIVFIARVSQKAAMRPTASPSTLNFI